MQPVYVAHTNDQLGVWALAILSGFGAQTMLLRGEDPTVQRTETVLFTGRIISEGRTAFPSKHLRRIILPRDVEERGFAIPAFALNAHSLVALRQCDVVTEEMGEALRQLHFHQPSGWIGPKRRRQRDYLRRRAERCREHGYLAL